MQEYGIGQGRRFVTVRLTTAHLDEIRNSVNWRAMFAGLGFEKAEKKSKPGDWWAFSPFHQEKTASFHMGPGGVWYDFSIGEGGGAIELVQKIQNCNCYEAGKYILEHGWAKAGGYPSLTSQTLHKTRNKVRKVVEKPTSQSSQHDFPENTPIRQDLITLCTGHELLESRGISEKTCEALGIGYLAQGRSPLKGRIIFQVADARKTKKSSDQLTRVILSHIGRAVKENQEPKYLFYEGFHKSSELYGQEILMLQEDAADQIASSGHILLSEGPFDVAKAYEAGLRNVVSSFGASLSEAQARKLKTIADHHGVIGVTIIFDRDKTGIAGAEKAASLLKDVGLHPKNFDWNAPVARTRQGIKHIPETINDLADFSAEQIVWLRGQQML